MENPAPALDAMAGELAGLLAFDDVRGLVDEALLQTTGALERLGRWVASRQVAAAAEIDDRSRRELGAEGLAAKKGCRNSTELLERLTLDAGSRVAPGRAATRDVSEHGLGDCGRRARLR
jgi:hypothetical protein